MNHGNIAMTLIIVNIMAKTDIALVGLIRYRNPSHRNVEAVMHETLVHRRFITGRGAMLIQ